MAINELTMAGVVEGDREWEGRHLSMWQPTAGLMMLAWIFVCVCGGEETS